MLRGPLDAPEAAVAWGQARSACQPSMRGDLRGVVVYVLPQLRMTYRGRAGPQRRRRVRGAARRFLVHMAAAVHPRVACYVRQRLCGVRLQGLVGWACVLVCSRAGADAAGGMLAKSLQPGAARPPISSGLRGGRGGGGRSTPASLSRPSSSRWLSGWTRCWRPGSFPRQTSTSMWSGHGRLFASIGRGRRCIAGSCTG